MATRDAVALGELTSRCSGNIRAAAGLDGPALAFEHGGLSAFRSALRKLQTMFGRHQDAPGRWKRSRSCRPAGGSRGRPQRDGGSTETRRSPTLRGAKITEMGRSRQAQARDILGLSAIVVSALIVVGAVLWFSWRLSSVIGEDDAVMLVRWFSSGDSRADQPELCVTVAFELEVLTSTAPLIEAIRIETKSPKQLRRIEPLSSIPTGLLRDRVAGQLAYEFSVCPESTDDIDHGPLIVTYRQDPPKSPGLRFDRLDID